ncbi:MAG: T9SS type A sorting domain-containing protein [Cyclobacteriaceae bacterium]|nr:T9SS type A sorting domain-containing protein [Cyclobacteriaceae bacterium]
MWPKKIVLSILISSGLGFVYGQTLEDDKTALIALYNATDGDNWSNNTNWITNPDVSTWFGVTVFGDRVRFLKLITNNLTGTLPTELGDLDALFVLDISNNNLSGSIPESIGNLEELATLALRQNGLFSGTSLTGQIPESIGNLTNLTQLDLGQNDLSGEIPSTLLNLTQLESLDISGNGFSGTISLVLTDLTQLTYLNIGDNEFSGPVPTDISKLNQLRTLILIANELSGSLPMEMFELVDLEWLAVGNNSLNGNIPSQIGLLSNLEYLDLSKNQFTGEIPTEVGQLNDLRELFFLDNQLSGSIPDEVGNLLNLEIFNARNNLLTGSLPEEFSQLEKLNFLIVSGNLLNEIPDYSDTPMTNSGLLEGFRVSDNLLTFEDLEPNIDFITENTEQKPFGQENTFEIEEGASKVIEFVVGGSHNIYQWEKDNVEIDGANSNSLAISNAQQSDAGVYILKVTNSLVNDLTLSSEPLTIVITEPATPDPVTSLEDKIQIDFGMFPNPTSDVLWVPFASLNNEQPEIKVFDNNGTPISVKHKADVHERLITVDVSDLSSGIYIIKIVSDNGLGVRKFVKN